MPPNSVLAARLDHLLRTILYSSRAGDSRETVERMESALDLLTKIRESL